MESILAGRTRSPSQQALADGSAEVLPAQPEALEANFLESEGLWKLAAGNILVGQGVLVEDQADDGTKTC